MDNTPEPERIHAYIEANRQTYTREAIRKQLLDNGYDPEAVDLALAQTYGLELKTNQPTTAPPSNVKVALIAGGIFLLNYAILIAFFAALIGGLPINILDWENGVLLFMLALFIAQVIGAAYFRRRNPTLGRGLSWGVLATIFPLIMLIIGFGVCVLLFRFTA